MTKGLRPVFFILFTLTTLLYQESNVFAQGKDYKGLVFDRINSSRVSQTIITNTRSRQTTTSDEKGQFILKAIPGDGIIASAAGYVSDTLKTDSTGLLIVYLQKNPLQLKEVRVSAKSATPSDHHAMTLKEFKSIYEDKPLNFNGLDFVTLSALFGKKAKQIDSLKGRIEKDYRESVIDSAFNKKKIAEITGLNGQNLTAFMVYFRPTYEFVTESNEYQILTYIRDSYRDYESHPDWYVLDSLPRINDTGQRQTLSLASP